jgi:alkanesulfonate monooxygenase SsuD/methylene tetrahydromethanopterin reductase-like flavin-dependent oxidoreductase (luciferase family)
MKLGINLGYFGLGSDRDNIVVAQEADRLGYATCWAAEVYGSDTATVLAYVAAKTERIGYDGGNRPQMFVCCDRTCRPSS